MFSLKRLTGFGAAPILAAVATAAIIGGGSAFAADHGDAPLAKANVPLDINDIYTFAGSGENVVLAMTVNPLTMPGAKPTFASDGLYQFNIDNDGDALADITYNVTFGTADSDGVQSVTLRKGTGGDAGDLTNSGDTLLTGDTTAPGTGAPVINEDGEVTLFAGLRDDPFFFDLNAFKAGLAFRDPGNDFFKGTNVSAIVIELPASDFLASGSTAAGVWGITSKSGAVIDRMGRPAIATVFIPEGMKDAFNKTMPDQDVAQWKATLVAGLTGLGADTALADVLLPDILTFDTAESLTFLNGRALADDVIDAELQLITGNPAATDNVDANDNAFSGSFPFLAAPNTATAPTPAPVASATVAASPGAPQATATRGVGVTAPDTGTGDGTSGGSDATMWFVLAIAGAAVVLGGGFTAARARK